MTHSIFANSDGAPRVLSVGTAVSGGASNNSVESCTAACFASGYPLAGVEYSDECCMLIYSIFRGASPSDLTLRSEDCGTTIGSNGAPAAAGDCNMACSGNGAELCGGPLRLNVYNYTGSNLPSINNGGGGGGGGGVTTVFPKLTGLPAGWSYNACWV